MKRRSSKRKPADKPDDTVTAIAKALAALPKPARAIVGAHIDDLDKFRRRYPRLYEVMFKNVDSEHYREFERQLERAQQRERGQS